MAKFRAARKLWARVEQACALTPTPAMVTAETAWRMMTKHDPYVNMLRTTIAVAAAGWAAPMPSRCCRTPRRWACPTLSPAASRATPSSCSGRIEPRPRQRSRRRLRRAGSHDTRALHRGMGGLREIEQQGGVWAALETGLIQRHAAAVRAERERAVARRTDTLTGTNEYPNINEVLPAVLDVAPAALPNDEAAISAAALPRIRLAEPFEQLRDASDKILAETGARPKVFLATLGKPADFNARANFAKNFFEAGGIEAVGGGDDPSPLAAGASRRPALRSPACAGPTRPMRARPKPLPLRSRQQARGAFIWPDGPARRKQPCRRRGCKPSFTKVAMSWRHCRRPTIF